MRVTRRFTVGMDTPYDGLTFVPRRSEIRNPDGTVVFKADDVMVPEPWSQVATDIIAQKYFRKAGVPAAPKSVKEKGVPGWLCRRVADDKALAKPGRRPALRWRARRPSGLRPPLRLLDLLGLEGRRSSTPRRTPAPSTTSSAT